MMAEEQSKNTTESTNPSKESTISICDIMKNNTSEVIKKLESQVPSLVQHYSDLYSEYLHIYDDLFGTCYIAEKEYFDKLNIDQGILRQTKEYSESMKSHYLDNIDMAAKLFDEYVKMRISAIKSFDNYVHLMMESYAKMLSQFNSVH